MKMIKFSDPAVEVIIISGINNLKTHEECVENGAFCCVLKPVNFKFLFYQIIQALKLRAGNISTRG
ncbi:hypothetical protein UR09_04805 [Candidatus Nitromaritima sp. SCGC AAA799-A02]|nr:hypothetical protein UR09_04805 [Candidatus Nitromaritima sp. SCGC AAA799-A02]